MSADEVTAAWREGAAASFGRIIVRTSLEAPFAINLYCGNDLSLIYNDGYRHVLGAKHPRALGRPGGEIWAEIWDEVQPMFDSMRAGGEPGVRVAGPVPSIREVPLAPLSRASTCISQTTRPREKRGALSSSRHG